jgi:hypothetical protein
MFIGFIITPALHRREVQKPYVTSFLLSEQPMVCQLKAEEMHMKWAGGGAHLSSFLGAACKEYREGTQSF